MNKIKYVILALLIVVICLGIYLLYSDTLIIKRIPDPYDVRVSQIKVPNVPDYVSREVSKYGVLMSSSEYTIQQLEYGLPFICYGDFDGNGLEDFCAILRKKSKDSVQQQIVSFRKSEKGYERDILVGNTNVSEFYSKYPNIETIKQGTQLFNKSGKSIFLRFDSIEVGNEHDNCPVFYRNGSKYNIFWKSMRDI